MRKMNRVWMAGMVAGAVLAGAARAEVRLPASPFRTDEWN